MSSAAYVFGIVNLVLLLAIVTLGVAIFFKFRKKDAELLKARMFLGKTIGNMWIYSTIVGGAFVLHQVLWALEQFLNVDTGVFLEISWTLFILSFTYLTYVWFKIIDRSIRK